MIVAASPGWLLSPAEMEQQKELMDGPRSNHGIAKRRARSPPMEKGSAASAESKRKKILRFSTEKKQAKRIKNKGHADARPVFKWL